MKITMEEIKDFSEILEEAESFRPLVEMILDALKSYSEEFKEIPEAFSRWVVDNRIKSIAQYKKAGFTKNDAIIMTLDDVFAVKKLYEKMNKSTNK